MTENLKIAEERSENRVAEREKASERVMKFECEIENLQDDLKDK